MGSEYAICIMVMTKYKISIVTKINERNGSVICNIIYLFNE